MRRGDGSLAAMHRTREQARRGPLARRLGRRILAGLPQQPTDALAAGRAVARGTGHAEACPEPAEEPIEDLPTPAPQASPAPPEGRPVHIQPEPRADRAPREARHDVKAERLEDHGRRVPAPRMQLVGEDADRELAPEAEEASDSDHDLDGAVHEPEHLAPIDPVTDDPEPPASIRRMAAPRAERRPDRLRGRRQDGKTKQAVDGSRQRPYNLHRSLAGKRRVAKRASHAKDRIRFAASALSADGKHPPTQGKSRSATARSPGSPTTMGKRTS